MKKYVYFLALPLVALQPLYGKVIQIQTQFNTDLRPDVLIASATIVNQGDEASRNVQLSVEWQGARTAGSVHSTVSIQEAVSETFHLPIKGLKPGLYPILLRISYADSNLYPFSGITAMIVNLKTDSNLGVWGALNNIALSHSGHMKLKLKNLDMTSKALHIRLFLPNELSAKPAEMETTLPEREEKEISFVIKNFSALPASTLNVYALIEYDMDGFHHASLALGSVRILDSALSSGDMDYIWMGLATGVFIVFLIALRLYRVRRSPKTR